MFRAIFGEQFWGRRTSFIEKFVAKKRASTPSVAHFPIALAELKRVPNTRETDYGERIRAIKSQQAQLRQRGEKECG